MEQVEDQPRRKVPGWATIVIILVVAALHGIIYIRLLPPWQHYDEPNHFEYAWLIANWKRLPQDGENDITLNRQLFDSMWASGFYGDPVNKPDIPVGDPVTLGYSQLNDPPAYYLAAAVPIWLTKSQSIETQLYAARFASLLMLLLTVLAGWGIAREITPQDHPLRWALPLTLALFPTFVELMTAVNNDAGGIVVFSMFVWASVFLIQRGFSWPGLIWASAMAILAVFTKNTAMPAILFLPLVILLSLFKGRVRWYLWGGFVVLVVVLAVLMVENGDAAWWYRSTTQEAFTRQESDQAILGEHVLALDTGAPVTPNWMAPLFQPIISWEPRGKLGNHLTLGVWMWADRPISANLPRLYLDTDQVYAAPVQLDTTPRFFSYSTPIPEIPTIRAWVNMEQDQGVLQQGAKFYYDGFLLVEGDYSSDQPPVFADPEGTGGTWQGTPFNNLIRNGSAETPALRIRPVIDQFGSRILPDDMRMSFLLTSLLDIQKSWKVYRVAGLTLFRSFWGTFAWGNVQLIGGKPYRVAGIVTVLGIFGYLLLAVQAARTKDKEFPTHSVLFFALAIMFVWFMTINRGLIYFSKPKLFIPVARYAFPTLIPVLYFLVSGWLALLFGAAKGLRLSRVVPATAYILILLVLDVLAIVSIYQYFNAAL